MQKPTLTNPQTDSYCLLKICLLKKGCLCIEWLVKEEEKVVAFLGLEIYWL